MNKTIPLLQDYLSTTAHCLPAKTALVYEDQRVSYGTIERNSDAMAATLKKMGIQRGDRIIIFADNSEKTVVAFWGILKANAVVSIINPLTKADKLTWQINDCRAKIIISDSHLFDVINKTIPNCCSLMGIILSGNFEKEEVKTSHATVLTYYEAIDNDLPVPERECIDIDLAAIIYTSGSTGDPKGVMLTHRNMITAATSVSTYIGMREEDIVLVALPFSFDYGLYQMIMSFKLGAMLIVERSFIYIGKVLNRIVAEKVTIFPGVPTIFSILSGMKNLHKYDLSAIRVVTNTAASLAASHITFLQNAFPQAEIYSMYGLTECHRCTYLPPKDIDNKPNSVGIAIPNTELWIVDKNGKRQGPNIEGEIVIRGATVMKGYWEKPEKTAEKLKLGPLPNEVVLYTGYLGKVDEEGYLYFIGRTDDIIKSRGEKIAPKEVENVLYCLREIKDAAVIGVEDDILGQAVKAYVVLHKNVNISHKQILAHCQRYLENYMFPKYIEIVEELPKTSSGKIKKTDLI